MFKFSFNWLKDYLDKNITSDEVFKILNLQGFEFEGSEKINNDIVTAIEVKANRPDMLSHMGVAREINAYKNEKLPKINKNNFKINNEKFNIKVNNEGICKRFCAAKIKNIDNKKETPEYIKIRLSCMGINLVNPVVDIINYVMLDLGQPMHCYDIDKLNKNGLCIKKAENDFKLETLNNTQAEVKKDDIIICNDEKVSCIAGIIGADFSSVTSESKNILIEAAVFNEVSIRLTSRRLKISTPSSFRFERGIDIEKALDCLYHCCNLIEKICGGEVSKEIFDFYAHEKKPTKINLSLKNTNSLLGTNLTINQIVKYLEKYDFKCDNINENSVLVTIPSHRITILKEVELIGEIARIHGYDNIEATMPNIKLSYKEDKIVSNKNKLRDLLLSLGFSETINYSFIPSNTMKLLEIENSDTIYGDVKLENPISAAYGLMRPTLCYSLVNCLAYNYSIKNSDISIFELGRTYFQDKSSDTKVKEIDTCAFLMSGIKNPKGWGQIKDSKFDYYDLLSYLNVIFNNFGQKYDLKPVNYKFCKKKTSYEIIVDNKKIGFIGQIEKSKFEFINNIKLVQDDIFYCEFYIENISAKDKKLEFESKYPPIKRLYNFIEPKDVYSKDVIEIIKSISENVIKIEIKDIYEDKNMPENLHAVLYEVTYCSKNSTLTCEQIQQVEKKFIEILRKKLNVVIKS